MTNWHDKKLKGLIIGATGAAGNAAARLEPFMTKAGMYSYGSLPEIDDLFQRQAKRARPRQARGGAAPDPEDRRRAGDGGADLPAGIHLGHRPARGGATAGMIQGFPYAGPCEDLKLK